MSASRRYLAADTFKTLAPYFLLIAAILAAYANVYGNGFLYDDITLILNNNFLRDWHFLPVIFKTPIAAGANISSAYYRPLQILLYFFIYQISGLSLLGFHLLNIGLHAANACLIYALGRKFNFNPWAVLFATLTWAVHPMHVEAITYMSGTADPLYVFFCLCGLLVLLPDFTPKKILYVTPLFILALLSKEEALTFPLLVMSCMFFFSKQRFQYKTYFRTWPLWLIAIVYVLLHYLMFPQGLTDPAIVHVHTLTAPLFAPPPYTFFATLPTYLQILFSPTGLHYERSFPTYTTLFHLPVLAGLAIFILAVLQILWRQDRRHLPLSWGLLWFGAAYALHAGLFFAADKPVYEHWMYLSSAGLFLGIAQSLALEAENKRAMIKHARIWCAAAVFLAVGLGWHTYKQNRVWHDAESLYGNVFANGETSPHAHNNLGMAYAEKGDYGRAREQFDLAIKISNGAAPEAEYNLGVILMMQNQGKAGIDEAIKHLHQALQLAPDYYAANKKLADCYDRTGDKGLAAAYRAKADSIHKKFMSPMP